MTKAANIWTEAYESARSVMTIDRALERADAVLLHRLNLSLQFREESGCRLLVTLRLPDDRIITHACVGYLTPTIRVRVTKAILRLVTPAVLAAAIPTASETGSGE
jgi:hypothetical protein